MSSQRPASVASTRRRGVAAENSSPATGRPARPTTSGAAEDQRRARDLGYGDAVRPDVWIPEATPAAERDRLQTIATVHVFSSAGPVDPDAPADLLVAFHDPDRAIEVAHALRRLVAFQTFSAGVDYFIGRLPDGVILCDAAGVHDVPVAEWVVMTILVSQRRLAEHLAAQRAGIWGTEPLVGHDLVDSTIVLVGAGRIGRAVEERLTGFGPKIVRVARRAREGVHPIADLPALLPSADIVVILLPLTPE
ncbi:MAG TPA: NAD(P)-dependent oxidoreductase, partial [Candidatus Acidoferrum sp.]|nr:NAD(P)-dependent oxidoreductase [Candidatus Acidoferrum sp.]